MSCQIVKTRHAPVPVANGATVIIASDTIGGFLATTAGNITITKYDEFGNTVALITSLAVPVGWTPLPFYLGLNGGTITSSGGAVGVLGA